MSQWKRNQVSKPRKLTRAALPAIFGLAFVGAEPKRVAYGLDQPVVAKSAPANRNAEAGNWFEDAKFGLFIDWGVDSLLGKGEWVTDRDKLPIIRPKPTHRRCMISKTAPTA